MQYLLYCILHFRNCALLLYKNGMSVCVYVWLQGLRLSLSISLSQIVLVDGYMQINNYVINH